MQVLCNVICAERLSARLLIVQCSRLYVCMYIYIYMYVRHTLVVWAWFHWSCPQTMSHVVLVWPRGDRNVIMQESKWSRPGPRGIGPTRRRSCEKDCARAEMERVSCLSVIVLESKNGNKGTLHQKRVRQRRKSLTDWGRSNVYRESLESH